MCISDVSRHVLSVLLCVYCYSASSGGGGGRGAPQHYPKTVGNRYVTPSLCYSKCRILVISYRSGD